MPDPKAFIRLQAWLSPAFPIGAFAYSHGLEAAVEQGLILEPNDLQCWISDLLSKGTGWNDAIILSEAWRGTKRKQTLVDLIGFAIALNGSKERLQETTELGAAFIHAAECWGGIEGVPFRLKTSCPLPIAVGAAAATHSIALELVVTAYLHAYVSNQIQGALRLIKMGQQQGVTMLAAMEPKIMEITKKASHSSLEELENSCLLAEVMAMQHETMSSRIFKS